MPMPDFVPLPAGTGRQAVAESAPARLWASRLLTLLAVAVVFVAGPVVPAAAQLSEGESLSNRLSRLERELQTLSQQVYRGGSAPTVLTTIPEGDLPEGFAARLEIRVSQLERQIQMLTGQVEQSQYQGRQVGDRLERALTDIEYRLTVLEGGTPTGPAPTAQTLIGQPPAPSAGGPAPLVAGGATVGGSAIGGQVVGAAPAPAGAEATLGTLTVIPPPETATAALAQPVALPSGDVTSQYDFAYGLLAQGEYVRAQQALVLFTQANPDHPLASNAQYWLGETYFVREQYNDAAISFAQSYQQFPQGAKAVDSLLKLGITLAAMGNSDDACLTYAQLDQEFPNAPMGIKRRVEQERNRLQCL